MESRHGRGPASRPIVGCGRERVKTRGGRLARLPVLPVLPLSPELDAVAPVRLGCACLPILGGLTYGARRDPPGTVLRAPRRRLAAVPGVRRGLGERHVRLTYDRGNLEFMTLSHGHEGWSKL